MRAGVVYSETVIHSAPEAFVRDAPYQVAIVDVDGGGRLSVRIPGERVAIGDRVVETGPVGGIPFFRRDAR
jgi:uncharacterized protein